MNVMSGKEAMEEMGKYYFNLHLNDDTDLGLCSKWYKESILDENIYNISQIIKIVQPILPHYYGENDVKSELERVRKKMVLDDEASSFRVCLPFFSPTFKQIEKDVEDLIRSSTDSDPYMPVLKMVYKIFNDQFLYEVA